MPLNFDVSFQEDVIDRLARIEEQGRTNTTVATDQETRIRGLEKRQWILAGLAAGLSPLLGKLGIHLPTL